MDYSTGFIQRVLPQLLVQYSQNPPGISCKKPLLLAIVKTVDELAIAIRAFF